MDFKENSIIVCNENVKKNILKRNFEEKKLCNLTFINIDEFIKRYTFKISKEAIIYSMKFLSMSFKNTVTIINNIYYVECDKEYDDYKLNKLRDLKKELIENKLLEFDLYFKQFIKGKNIYVVGEYLDVFQKHIFSEVQNSSNVFYVTNDNKKLELDVYSFEKYNDEAEWVFSQILTLLNSGTNINDIYIINENNEYNHLLYRYSNLYKIPVHIKENESIDNHQIIKEFLSNLSVYSIEFALEKLNEYKNKYLYNKVVEILNDYYFIEDKEILTEVLEALLSNVKYEEDIEKDCVNVVGLDYDFKDTDHVFLISFNNNTYPKTYLDEAYLPDKYFDKVLLTPTLIKNKLERNKAIYSLSKINNIYISFSKLTKVENVISSITSDVNTNLKTSESKVGLSKDIDNLKVGIMIDELINFDNHNTNLDLLFSSLNPSYKTYDNSFDFVDKDVLKEKIKSSIKLSYTSLSTFYKCQFRYYLERVLYLNRSEDTNAIMIGNMFHAILEKYGTEGFDLEAERKKQYDSITDISTRFYFNKLWPDFLLALEVIDEFREVTYLKDELHEQEVNIDLSDDYFTKIFTGKIDKIIYKTIDKVDYVSIIDYKTGKDIPSLDNVADGFNLQLPVYAYFLVKTELLKNPKILGIYLQRILNNSKPTKTKDLLTVQKDALKLDGYSTIDKKDLALLDPNYSKSSYIKSMSLLKDGSFNRYAKVFSAGDINDLIKMVEELINEAFSDIEQGNFNINPKSINGNNKSCQFCPYMNICYRKNKDIKVIDEKKFKETVGDEDGLH